MTNPPQGSGQGWNPAPMPSGTTAPVKKRTNTPLIILVAILTLGLIGGGAVFALSRGGGGTSTAAAEAVASTADAVVTVNLEPDASKRVEMYQFFSKFPSIKEQFDKDGLTQDADFKKAVVEAVFLADAPDMTYEKDFKPWMGNALAVAGDVVDGEMQGYVAIESTDDAKARETFSKWKGAEDFDIVNGYVVLWNKDQKSPVDAIKAEPLSKNADYKHDTADLASDAPIAFWVGQDVVGSVGAARGSAGNVDGVAGRVAGTLDVTADSAKLSATVFSDTITKADGNVSDLVKGLSDDADLVFASSMSEKQLTDFWKTIDPIVGQGAGDLPLRLPDDLFGVLTPEFAVSLDTGSLAGMSNGEMPKVAIATKGGDLAAHQKLAGQFGLDPSSSVKAGDVVVSATTPDYAQAVAEPSSKLGDNPAFTKAVTLGSDANLVAYWNPSKFVEQDQSSSAEDLRAISSVSVVGTTKKDHESTLVISVTAK